MRTTGRMLLIVLLCAAVYLPLLGRGGLRATEGHRTIPAVEMSERGDWLVPTMFDTPYLRKPPGVFWTIRVSSEAFGWNEFSARLVSAAAVTLGAIAAGIFGMRWFGVRDGWWAGAIYALQPVVFETGRAAEIEALNNLAALVGAALIIDTLVRRPGTAFFRAVVGGGAIGAAVFASVLAKGPAAGTVFIGAVGAAAQVRGSFRPLVSPALWIGLVIATLASVGVGTMIAGELASWPEPHVFQSPTDFAFEPGRLAQIALLVPSAFAAHLPASLALLIVLWPGARATAGEDAMGFDLARAAALAWVIAVGLLMLAGTSNPRYAQPAVGLACLCVPWVVRGIRGSFSCRRELWARLSVLGSPWILVAVFVAVAAVRIALLEPMQLGTSGREPGRAIEQAVIDDGGFEANGSPVLYADQLIEARPETLLYAERAASARGFDLRVRWAAQWDPVAEAGPSLPSLAPGAAVYLVLRTDTDEFGSSELERFERAGLAPRLFAIEEGAVHKYSYTLYRLMPEGWDPRMGKASDRADESETE